MRKLDLSNLPVLLEIAGLRDDPAVLALAEAAGRTDNPIWREQLTKILSERIAEVVETHPYAPSPAKENLPNGDISLGRVLLANMDVGDEVKLGVEDMCMGTIILGATGSGKSAEMFWICDQLTEKARVWIFDREGEASTKMAASLRTKQFKYIHYRHFARNLLQCMNRETPREMLNRLISYWRTELTMGDGSENIVAECLYELLDERGVLHGGQDYPTIWHLLQKLRRLKPRLDARQRAYWETAYNRISVLLTLMGDVYDHKIGYDLEALLNENLVIDLQGISDSHHRFFVSDLLSCAMAIKERQDWDRVNVFAIDELHRYARSSTGSDPWAPYLFQVARLGRKRGIAVLLSDQVPSQIPAPVMANMSTRLALRTINGPCKESIARSMGLNREQTDWLGEMPRRTAVMHSVVHPGAFALAIPEIQYEEPLSIQELLGLEAEFLEHLTSEKREEDKMVQAPRATPTTTEPSLSKRLLDYMVSIDQKPFVNATERDKTLGLTSYMGNKLRAELQERGLASLHRVSLGGRGRNIVLVELAREAYEILGKMGVRPTGYRGKGSIVHRFWQHRIVDSVRERHPDWVCVIEDASSGKSVDLSIDTGEKRVACEVCITGPGKEIGNIARDEGYEEVVILAQDERTLLRIKEKAAEVLGDKGLERVRFEVLSQFEM